MQLTFAVVGFIFAIYAYSRNKEWAFGIALGCVIVAILSEGV